MIGTTPTLANEIATCSEACAVDCDTAGFTEPSCEETVTGFCLIDDDISCTSSSTGVGLYQGATLMFSRGKKLVCPNDDCGSAVKIKGAGSTVTTYLEGSGAPALGGTEGGFHYTIDCGGWNNSVVDHLRINGGLVAVENCETVTNNIIEGSDRFYASVNFGIEWKQKVNSLSAADSASNNVIRDKVWSIAASGSGTKILAEDNHVMTSNNSAVVFYKDSNAEWTVRDNVIHGSGDLARTQYLYSTNPVIFSGSTTGATATNDCSVDDHLGCTACVTSGACKNYIPD